MCGGNSGDYLSESEQWQGSIPACAGETISRELLIAAVADGSIPACAGETLGAGAGALAMTVHPRVCGGNRCACHTTSSLCGPSPRVRGKLWHHPDGRMVKRSIPACAGETREYPWLLPLAEVHPRVCGGNDICPDLISAISGPSPRVRGKQQCAGGGWKSYGSIPACAGETQVPSSLRVGTPVHPRVCGGNTMVPASISSNGGPSPRVRGKRVRGG